MTQPESPREESPTVPPSPSGLDFPVVGIGASAGGLAAVSGFLKHVAADPGMAFVVVLHLSPTHESHAGEILQRHTSLHVTQISEPTPIRRNCVYVIPPGKDLSMQDGHLRLAEQTRQSGRHGIDAFFRTLAEAHGPRAFGIVLSGTGADGAVGLKTLKERGGVSIAQRPDEAEHDGMPLAAIQSGVVDFILPIAEIPGRLATLWSNARRIRLPGLVGIKDVGEPDEIKSSEEDEVALGDVLTLLRTRTRHEFRQYKRGTVLRRIERRMQVNGIPTLPSYRDYLRGHEEETAPLLQDMLISVTNFFRDPEAFAALEREVIPRILEQHKSGEPIRVWVPGCATGEEAYSISILLREQCDLRANASEIQIFATDIDDRAIAIARTGCYPTAIEADLSAARLHTYFRRDGDQYRVSKAVRDGVLFASHNLLRDPPFSRVDLICCRNVLIYLNQNAQRSVLETFRFALNQNSFLFLGSSESVDAIDDSLTPLNKKYRIFQFDSSGVRAQATHLVAGATTLRPVDLDGLPRERRSRSFGELHQQALEQHALPSVLIDGRNHIVHLSPGAGRYLEHGSGKPSHDLVGNAAPELRAELRTAIFTRSQTGKPVTVRGIAIRSVDGARLVDLFIYPYNDSERASGDLTLVLFGERLVEERAEIVSSGRSGDSEIVHRLTGELDELKHHLQATVEQSNASTEDLRASNEELQAMNEELRSATEELETSKEELQSINEELTTVNEELKNKVDETAQVNNDLQNLIASTDIAVVFVDAAMRVQRFTPRATDLFNLIATDIGRPLSDVKHRFDGGDPVADAEQTFRTLKAVEREVHGADGRTYFGRVLPYRTVDDRIEGAILTYVDITTRREAEAEAFRIAQQLRRAAETTRDFAIVTTDEAGTVRGWNAGAERTFGYADDEIVGRSIDLLYTEEDRVAGVPALERQRAKASGRAEDERWQVRKDGSRFFCSGVVSTVHDGESFGFAKIARDMTGSKLLETRREAQLLRERTTRAEAEASNRLKDEFLAVMSHELKHPLNLIHINAELLTRSPDVRELPAIRRAAETIRITVAHQAKIIDDLLDLSRARTGKMTLRLVSTRVDQLLSRIVEATQSSASGDGVVLRFDSAGMAALSVMCDPVRLEQIVWNLVSNALKFTSRGGSVDLSLSTDGAFVRLDVKDTGRGISPAFLPNIFGMFQQEKPGYSTGESGMGIGLALVKELAEAQGGRVSAQSEGEGKGALFSVWIPRADGSAAQTTPAVADIEALAGMRILLVEDSPEILEVMAELLASEGAIVTSCDSGHAALEHLDRGNVDLLISDIGMPEMDGYQLINEVRKRPASKDLRSIALTGFGRDGDARRAEEVGFDAHLVKPTSLRDLVTTILQLGVARGSPAG